MFVLSFILVLKQQFIECSSIEYNSIEHIMGIIKQINIKNHTYYFFNDMINIKESDSGQLKIYK